jgi:hypothetical protein
MIGTGTPATGFRAVPAYEAPPWFFSRNAPISIIWPGWADTAA